VFDAALLHLPIGSRDPHLCTLLERQAERLLASLPEPRRFTRAVKGLVASAIEEGNPGAERVAVRLGVHVRTLGRRLRGEGTTYRRLLEEVRREIAERHFTVSDKTVSEVAFSLGYAHASTFHKAFRRWTGTAPDAYRRRVRLDAAGEAGHAAAGR
jgi:AraC-like DNA-binding protein